MKPHALRVEVREERCPDSRNRLDAFFQVGGQVIHLQSDEYPADDDRVALHAMRALYDVLARSIWENRELLGLTERPNYFPELHPADDETQ
jgi:hypothetical protein